MRKIIVADSASITVFMLERILGKDGHKIIYIKYPRDLIAQVKEIMPDVIFLEPEISFGKGQRIVEYLNRQPETSHIPIILITRIPESRQYGMDRWPGVHALIRRPLIAAKVLEAMESLDFPDDEDFSSLQDQSNAS